MNYLRWKLQGMIVKGVLPALLVDYLVVAGGGGGGITNAGNGGGGGAGGLLYSSATPLNIGTNYTVTIGVGGASGSAGANSVFNTATAIGGGKGGLYSGASSPGAVGGNGGCGGGAGQTSDTGIGGGIGSQGYNGGSTAGFISGGAGGGGMGAVGSNAGVPCSGPGGIGLDYSAVFGTGVGDSGWFAGGGGGSAHSSCTTQSTTYGGRGGGGNGRYGATAGGNGMANTGGGGGGGGENIPGGSGGSGVVILKFPDAYPLTVSAGLTYSVTTSEGYKIYTFTEGSGTVRFSNDFYDAYTTFLLHCDGEDNGVVITDEVGHIITRVGDTCTKTAIKKFGTASLYFDGNGDYLTLDGSSDFAFGTGDFTIDMWVYRTANTGNSLYDSRPWNTNGAYMLIYVDGSGVPVVYVNSTDIIRGVTAISLNTWCHLALVRSGTSTKLYIDGTQTGSTYTDNITYGNGLNRPIIGTNGYDLSTSPYAGYIDEIRVSKGIARWTSDFTPPTGPYTL